MRHPSTAVDGDQKMFSLVNSNYLKSVRPLLEDEEYNKVVQMAREFENTIASSLQLRLWFKWLFSYSYVDDWWKEFAYLRSNESLLHTCVAAVLTMGGVPLCAKQYSDALRTIRVAGPNGDRCRSLPPQPRHCAVFHRGCWYSVPTFHRHRMLRPAELELTLQSIIDNADKNVPQKGEKFLSALTAGSRDRWAAVREKHFSNGVNKISLETIENAHEVIYLDEENAEYDDEDMTKIEEHYRRTLTGYGYQVWLDHPETMIISKNAKFCSNGEHSVADALIFCHMIEYFKYHESYTPLHQYSDNGHAKGAVEFVPKAERLQFEINDECDGQIEESYQEALSISKDFNNAVLIFQEYGKNFMKTIGVSPDAFIQMAIQLAYYREQGKFGLTYEASLSRMYSQGRTETVRTVTEQSCDFVRAMDTVDVDRAAKLAALRSACGLHQTQVRHAMAGKGADRHLFALYVLSRYMNVESPFLNYVLSQPFLLSTSQTAQHQQSDIMKVLNCDRDLFWPAGAFQAPKTSHYGVSYAIESTGTALAFHISAWNHHANSDAQRFRDMIRQALRDMRQLAHP